MSHLFHHGRLPREGFHADVLGGIIKRTALNPTLLVPLVLFARLTTRGQQLALYYRRSFSIARILAILGAIRVLNAWLSRRAVNNGLIDKYDWTKEVVVVTGGSDGIGKVTTLMLASKGIKVAVLDIQPLTYNPPSTVSYFQCDISSTSSIQTAANSIRSTIGNPTVLINNAGVCRGKTLLENTDADLALTFNVNTIAHYKLAREFVPYMLKHNHGMVVTVASVAAMVTAPRMTEYAASKAAATAFHEGLAAELVATYEAPRVRTVLVNQAYTQTSLFEGFDTEKKAFFGPALEVGTVAQAIVEQVLSGESGQIILPGVHKIGSMNFRSLPDWITYPARAQMRNLMAGWSGRQVKGLQVD